MKHLAVAVAIAVLLGACAAMAGPRRQASRNLDAAYDYDPSLPLEAVADEPKVEGRFTTQRVVFASTYGERISALLVAPVGVKRPPVLLDMHGLACSKDDAKNWAKIAGPLGIAVFAIDMPFHGERALESTDWQIFRDKSLGPLCMRRTVLDNLRALDYLQTRKDLSVREVPLLGGSMGAVLGAIVAALEPRVAGACLISGSAAPGPRPGTYVHLSDPAKADLDVTNFIGRIAPRPVLLMTGDADNGVPVAYAEALYAAARDPRELFVYNGGHVPGPEVMEANGGAARIRQWVTDVLSGPSTGGDDQQDEEGADAGDGANERQ
jgi:dienelactone hydrolase